MILDSKEKSFVMDVPADAVSIERYEVDAEGIERGERSLIIPEGIRRIEDGAFALYNDGPVAANIRYMLTHTEEQIAEWSKKLLRRQLVKITFPPEAGTSVSERSAFLVEKEMRLRLLQMTLPYSTEKISALSFPIFLERINIADKHPLFQSIDGVLISSDGKTLIRYPGYTGDLKYRIPETIEHIADHAFESAYIPELVISENVKSFGKSCFSGAIIGKLVFEEGITCIPERAFSGCRIDEITLPGTLQYIADYAFAENEGLKRVNCSCNAVAMGSGIFSRCRIKDISWWPWQEIPFAAFMNSRLEEIVIPIGVRVVGDYAFAGCFTAKRICLPESVETFGDHSFDEGELFTGEITMPGHLYPLIYRFPALSTINNKNKSEIWKQLRKSIDEADYPVMNRQRAAFKKGLQHTKLWDFRRKARLNRELQFVEAVLSGMPI